MDSRSRQKGFTTVELVIVMAVIAILATVLIPTFSNLITQAEEAAALQEASSILKSYFIDKADDTAAERDFYIHAKGHYFRVIDGQLQKDGDPAAPAEIGAIILSASPDAPYYKAEAVTAPEANGEHEHNFFNANGSMRPFCTICGIEHKHNYRDDDFCDCGAYKP